MRHQRLSAAIALSVLGTTGCGPDSASDSNQALNPAASVSLSFETLTVANETGLPEVIPNTVFYDFYRGLEPLNDGDDQNVAAVIRGRIDALMGLTPSADGTTYVAARNPLDFLNFVIDSNWVTTFNEGRQLMRDSISRGDPARYNTPAKNATIRFTGPDGSTDPVTDELWVYPLLDWTSVPLSQTILTARQFIARGPEDNSQPPPEVQSIIWSARFQAAEFAVSGYNRPEYALFSQTTRTLGNGELRQEYIGQKGDTFFLINPPPAPEAGQDAPQCNSVPPEKPLGITLAGQSPDCIRVEVDYPNSTVRVFASTGEAREREDTTCSLNANFCGNQRSSDGAAVVTYDSVTIGSRQ